jgi:hypothetical protein
MTLAQGRSAARRRILTTAVRLAQRQPYWRVETIVPGAKGKIPRIAVRPIQPIGFIDHDWQKLEATLGHSIPEKARASITLATNEFLEFAEAEINTGSMKDAVNRLSRLRSSAQSFRAAIEERALTDPIRGYVDEALEIGYARLSPGDLTGEYVAKISADLALFLNACDLTVQWLGQDARHNYWPEGGAWERS